MSANKESLKSVLTVALGLCIVCSVIVSSAAVVLKPQQEANKARDLKRNILMAGGLYDPELTVEEQFESIEARLVDLDSGRFVEGDVDAFDQRKASKDPSQSRALTGDEDPAKILRREDRAVVYLVNSEAGDLNRIILPVRGYGLWSTLYGFVALEADANTIVGLGFYEHGETPGLGGEVDNPSWKQKWSGKLAYRDGEVAIEVLKGAVNPASSDAAWQVDGLSGATLTTNGVENLVQYWLGNDGFAPLLDNIRGGRA
ncbi:MAG: Na(+)-translocating NADH-quinone reductase subunit C [Halieaceae bacterium MED-G27]|nr:Na(+)-translocating NADH-quinone reductase subunit C [Halieaceae bacterium]OUT66500.1 MAG: Na(+)-translocating NADH-quinone reductase subunit C [Cellvibrionales bacterium TMED21]PDH38412.1 MAG: Na(+)-translocating NADH-quinone reductase subunit C [Halieaceae bacterium MED-G27]